MRIGKKILNKLHVVLGPLAKFYLSKPRWYSYRDIKVLVLPSVFHPGLFFSTKILLRYLEAKMTLIDKTLLELGAGSGLISIFCAKSGANVTSSDINPIAIEGLVRNADVNGVKLNIIKSDLFDEVGHADFDIVVINPPYFPRSVVSEHDYAWFCGEDFGYFIKLFDQLAKLIKPKCSVLMILSEDCKIAEITRLADDHGVQMKVIHSEYVWGEHNFIFELRIPLREKY